MTLWIDKSPYWFNSDGIAILEETYNVKHMGHWCIKNKFGNWSEMPVEVFYSENPDTEKGHSHFLGVFIRDGSVFLCDAQSAFSEEILGKTESLSDSEVIVSRYRHDYRTNKNLMVDGGRDYFRASATGHTVKITVENGNFVFTPI